jgi:hypothetical protein
MVRVRSTLFSPSLRVIQHDYVGKGSFFKSHKDTPRGEAMFASLVVVFPTLHSGGSLVLRHGGKEWVFDSAKEVHGQSSPSVAYIAFYSDVEHEVMPVETGYRVTLTYNLYFSTRDPLASSSGVKLPSEVALKTTLSDLLDDSAFLSKGGYIGFGLRHEYPLKTGPYGDLRAMLNYLKGSDAVVKKVCEALSLKCSLEVIYQGEESEVMVDHVVEFEGYRNLQDPIEDVLENYADAVSDPIWWITHTTSFNEVKSAYVRYGNEATLDYLYGTLALIVHVKAFRDRKGDGGDCGDNGDNDDYDDEEE